MATAAYWRWVEAGRRYTVATPIAQMVAAAKAAGVGWLGTLGKDDKSHLQADRPQDHCPFSVTAWPVALPGYIVTACDLADGPWCDQFLADCKAGLHPWVKYINFRNGHYDVRTGWERESSSDTHFHVSCRTDYLNASIVNPFMKGSNMPGLLDNAERGITALIAGTELIQFPAPWNAESKVGYPNPLILLSRQIDGLIESVNTLIRLVEAQGTPEISDAVLKHVLMSVGDALKVMAGGQE